MKLVLIAIVITTLLSAASQAALMNNVQGHMDTWSDGGTPNDYSFVTPKQSDNGKTFLLNYTFSFGSTVVNLPNVGFSGLEYANGDYLKFTPTASCVYTITGQMVEVGTSDPFFSCNLFHIDSSGVTSSLFQQNLGSQGTPANSTLTLTTATGVLTAGQTYGLIQYSQIFTPQKGYIQGDPFTYTNTTATGFFQFSVTVPEPNLLIAPAMLLLKRKRRKI